MQKRIIELAAFSIISLAKLLLGTKIYFDSEGSPNDIDSKVIVVNHQSAFDIPLMIWYLRKYNTKFVAKSALRRGIPGVSLYLRTGGSVFVDRNNLRKSLRNIAIFAQDAAKKKYGAVIFPEGTRSKNGVLKPFNKAGVTMLLKNMPNAQIIPVCIDGAWKLAQSNFFPLALGVRISIKQLQPISTGNLTGEQLTEIAYNVISNTLQNQSNYAA